MSHFSQEAEGVCDNVFLEQLSCSLPQDIKFTELLKIVHI